MYWTGIDTKWGSVSNGIVADEHRLPFEVLNFQAGRGIVDCGKD
jgi:hypothetical protein